MKMENAPKASDGDATRLICRRLRPAIINHGESRSGVSKSQHGCSYGELLLNFFFFFFFEVLAGRVLSSTSRTIAKFA